MSDAELLLLAESRKKSGWVAAFLNLLIPGTGYIYCGMWIIGVFVLFLAIVIGAVTLGTGLLILYPILFIDGFLGAGRANRKMIEKLIKDRASIQRAQTAAT